MTNQQPTNRYSVVPYSNEVHPWAVRIDNEYSPDALFKTKQMAEAVCEFLNRNDSAK